MEKLLVFIPAYNCEKQVTRVLSQLLDQRIAPWVGECIVDKHRSADGTEPPCRTGWPATPTRRSACCAMTRTTVWAAATRSRSATRRPTGTSICRAARRRPGRYCGPAADSERRHLQKIRLLPWLPLYEGSKTGGYSALRTCGNYGFNWLFSLVVRKKITDLGSG